MSYNRVQLIHSFSDKWKRTRRYKEGSVILRDFENQNGRVLTIAEHAGKLFIYALAREVFTEILLNSYGNQHLGHLATKADALDFITNCVQEDQEIVYQENLYDALERSSWTVWNMWTNKQPPNNYDIKPISEFLKNSKDTENLCLYYGDENGTEVILDHKDILQVFSVGMHNYGTAYRIFIFETKDHQLLLGCNQPD